MACNGMDWNYIKNNIDQIHLPWCLATTGATKNNNEIHQENVEKGLSQRTEKNPTGGSGQYFATPTRVNKPFDSPSRVEKFRVDKQNDGRVNRSMAVAALEKLGI